LVAARVVRALAIPVESEGNRDHVAEVGINQLRSSHIRIWHQASIMSFLAWNYQGSGGNLGSSKILHLGRLITSTNTQVIFLLETRNSIIANTALINHFQVDHAHVVPSQGLSGGFGCSGSRILILI
jgi:hypothetical protein